jgi:hypothetical protein
VPSVKRRTRNPAERRPVDDGPQFVWGPALFNRDKPDEADGWSSRQPWVLRPAGSDAYTANAGFWLPRQGAAWASLAISSGQVSAARRSLTPSGNLGGESVHDGLLVHDAGAGDRSASAGLPVVHDDG